MAKSRPGLIRGTPAFDVILPRDPLPPVRIRIARPGRMDRTVLETHVLVADGVAAMVEAYGLAAPSRAKLAERLALGQGNQQARRACLQIVQAGCDPGRYADYVVMTTRGRHKRVPQPQEVWGAKAVAAWLPEYKRHAAGQEGRATYEATPARRAQYAKVMGYDLLPASRVG